MYSVPDAFGAMVRDLKYSHLLTAGMGLSRKQDTKSVLCYFCVVLQQGLLSPPPLMVLLGAKGYDFYRVVRIVSDILVVGL